MVRSLALAALAATGALAADKLFTVEVNPGDIRQVTSEGKMDLKRQGLNFIDITNHPNLASHNTAAARLAAPTVTYPSNVTHKAAVEGLIGEISKDNMKEKLTTYSDFHNRYYERQSGADASEWLLEQVRSTLGDSAGSAEPYEHSDFIQNSIIATIPGKSEKVIIVGAHLDSINLNGNDLRAPGADDDGSGSIGNLESLRVLLTDPNIAAGKSEHTIEFHWYAAEEGGTLGSADIFDEYSTKGVDVVAMLQQDMTGYVYGDGAMGVITDNTDSSLNAYMRILIDAYTTVGWKDSKCGYGCSDHASANAAGYPAAMIFESTFEGMNPAIHTAQDTLDSVSFDHMAEHANMVVGFVYELAHDASL